MKRLKESQLNVLFCVLEFLILFPALYLAVFQGIFAGSNAARGYETILLVTLLLPFSMLISSIVQAILVFLRKSSIKNTLTTLFAVVPFFHSAVVVAWYIQLF